MKINFEFQSEGVCRIETNDISRISSVRKDDNRFYIGKYTFVVYFINRESLCVMGSSKQECEDKRNELIKLWDVNNSITKINLDSGEDEIFTIGTETIFSIGEVNRHIPLFLHNSENYRFQIYFNGGDDINVDSSTKQEAEEKRNEIVKIWMNNN